MKLEGLKTRYHRNLIEKIHIANLEAEEKELARKNRRAVWAVNMKQAKKEADKWFREMIDSPNKGLPNNSLCKNFQFVYA